MKLSCENDSFRAGLVDQVQVIQFKRNLLHHLTELDHKEALIEILEEAGVNDSVGVILILGCRDKEPASDAMSFISELISGNNSEQKLSRVFNALDQLVMHVKASQKMVIHGDVGEIIAPLFNLSLACDYRIVGHKVKYRFASLELGLLPKGGSIYHLREKLGSSKTWELLFSGRAIDAKQAMAMGLVEQIALSHKVEEEALECARRFSKVPPALMWGAKKLINCPASSLPAFLKYENMVLLENIYANKFKNRIEEQAVG